MKSFAPINVAVQDTSPVTVILIHVCTAVFISMYFSLLIILTCMLSYLFVKESTSSQELNRLKEENSKVTEELQAKIEENNHLKEELAKTMDELTTLKEVNEIHNAQQQSVSV